MAKVKLIFEVELSDITVQVSKSNGKKYFNLPYLVEGTLGKKRAVMKAGRVTIPYDDEPAQKKAADPTVKLDKAAMSKLI